MDKKHRKILMTALKLVVAFGLLAWLVSKVSWSDYVTTADGKNHAVIKPISGGFEVSDGLLWWASRHDEKLENLKPILDKDKQPVMDDAGRPLYVQPGFAGSIKGIKIAFILLALAGLLASNLVVGTRWWFLLRIQDIRIKWWEAIRLTFLGIFFNNFAPSTIGGDLVKAYYISRHTPKTAAVLVSMFVDRVLGLIELTALAGVMITLVLTAGWESYANIRLAVITVVIVIGLVVAAMAFLLSARFRRLFHLQKIYQRLPIAHHIVAAGDAATLYRQRIGSLIKAIGITFGAHVLWVGSLAMIGMSLPGMAKVPLLNFFIYIPLIYIIGALPITIGGVGLVEGLYVSFFATAASPSAVLAMALLARFVPMVWGLPGVVVAVTGPKLPKAADMEAELAAKEEMNS